MSKHATKNLETTARPERDPLSAFGHEVLGLFRGPLTDVRFPELDRSVLEARADEVRRAQLEIEAQERALDEARARLRDANASFTESATRAVAYARVFAIGQPALEALLAGSPTLVGSARDAGDGKPEDREKKRRGRRPKDTGTADLLINGAPDDAPDESIAAE